MTITYPIEFKNTADVDYLIELIKNNMDWHNSSYEKGLVARLERTSKLMFWGSYIQRFEMSNHDRDVLVELLVRTNDHSLRHKILLNMLY